jgi:hypothetical protein
MARTPMRGFATASCDFFSGKIAVLSLDPLPS